MTPTDAWAAVTAEATRLKPVHLRQHFAEDPGRFPRLTATLGDLTVDYSREKLDDRALAALLDLAHATEVEALRDRMAAGETVNLTEGRAVLHMALRGSVPPPPGDDVNGTLDRFLAFAEAVRKGDIRTEAGPFTDVINIGIGGSDLGPVMAARALRPDCDGPRLHFISNVDGAHMTDVTRDLDPARTLVIIASKTFTTLETMANAETVRDWLAAAVGDRVGDHMAAVSTNLAGCAAFGLAQDRVFGFWDWVGGRYSLWSAIGLPVAIGIGAERFRTFLDGAAAMDRHFLSAPLAENLPVLLALIGVWRRTLGYPSVALIPYDERLARFPAYVQQLDMESNGKGVSREGKPLQRPSGPVIWGEPGTNAQHSFFQLLHQGTDVTPVDFIVAAKAREDRGRHHAILLANALAQAEALAFGKTEGEVKTDMAGADPAEIERLAPHRTFAGDRPSTTILHRQLDPFALGRLVALFEHKVFVQGAIWGVNSYDQWGVELGKDLAKRLFPVVEGADPTGLDPTTAGLIARIQALRSD